MHLKIENECDVREDIAMPLLTGLGYQKGTVNDIKRELSLSLKQSLGRKKKKDPVLKGIADYILVVTGVGRWVLETKAPNIQIGIDEIEQAITYARHPKVSGLYAAILNGKRFVLMHNSQQSSDTPLLDILVDNVEHLVTRLTGTLSPSAIRREFKRPIIDTNQPLASGFRSRANILKGSVTTLDVQFNSDNLQFKQQFDIARAALIGRRTNIIGGEIWRDADSRIKARLEWDAPHEEMLGFIKDKNFNMFEFVCLTSEISQTCISPSLFDITANINISESESIFDPITCKTNLANTDLEMAYSGQCIGYLEGKNFKGEHVVCYDVKIPNFPQLKGEMIVKGNFNVEVDDR
jgi:Type I restriction enzyme R protein N terminus (HSDR_N)